MSNSELTHVASCVYDNSQLIFLITTGNSGRTMRHFVSTVLLLFMAANPSFAQIANGSFETPAAATYVYDPTGTTWIFGGDSGIEHNGSVFGAPAAPSGVQAAFLQRGTSGNIASISQTFNVPTPGTYKITFEAALREYNTSGTQMSFNVTLDGSMIGSFKPTSTAFASFSTNAVTLTAATHTVTFIDTQTAADTSDFIDLVALTPSATPPPPPQGTASVTTYHNNIGRTGWNPNEPVLSASSFPSTFRALKMVAVDDQVDAQPLLMPGLTIAGGTHDVVYVVTENNSIYAIDAASGQILLSLNLGPPVPAPLGCNNNGPNVGITSTPVIDPITQTIYVIAYLNNGPTYQIHALGITTLQDRVPPVTVAASHTLTEGSIFKFNAAVQRQRPGLLLLDGVVYAGFGSFCDFAGSQSRGWILGWNVNSLTPLVANELADTLAPSSTNFFLSSLWMSGYGIAGASPNLYFVTGNSSGASYTGTTNIQESAVGLHENTLAAIGQLFTEPNHVDLDNTDGDFGSGGLLLLPDQAGPIPHVALAAGKDGILYLLNRDKFSPPVASYNTGNGCWCGPSYFMGPDGIPRVVTSHGSQLQTWHVNLSPSDSLSLASTTGISSGQDPGFFTSVSSNGVVNGTAIIWAIGRPIGGNIHLYAFNALAQSGQSSLTTLFSAPAGTWPFASGNANIVPTVANGRVYVGAYKTLMIFGTN
jgi:hypothetical protein